MKTLFLAWQASRPFTDGGMPTRAWYPIGRMDAIPEEHLYRFVYIGGALGAREEAGFEYLEAFPDLAKTYESAELFPLFRNRLMNPNRRDYSSFVSSLALDPANVDPLDILAISGGERQTDRLEVFPKIRVQPDGSFTSRFFLHGWRHVNDTARRRIERMAPGDSLRVAVELNNPVTGEAIQLQTADDYCMIGWAPRYLVSDLLQAISESTTAIHAHVVQINPAPLPSNQRALIELAGKFPQGREPMSAPDFQPLVQH